jgi:hypothetical protein
MKRISPVNLLTVSAMLTLLPLCVAQATTGSKPTLKSSTPNKLQKSTSTRIVLRTEAPCTVSLDGNAVKEFQTAGTYSLSVTPGEHVVDASDGSGSTYSQTVEISSGLSKVIKIQLTKSEEPAKASHQDDLAKQAAEEEQRQAEETRRLQEQAAAAARQRQEEAAQRAAERDRIQSELSEAREELQSDTERMENAQAQFERDEQNRQQMSAYSNTLGNALGGMSSALQQKQVRDAKNAVEADKRKIRDLKRQLGDYSNE